ncbi:MAG: PilZ domain-containing protein [Nitrospirales bacterium]|nr:PilZ domain-containing protein [Nitrospirales bacterium]
MQIWTTPVLQKLLLKEELPVRLCPAEAIEKEFLQQASSADMAVIDLTERYGEFLASARAKALQGPIILISEKTADLSQDILSLKGLHLSLETVGAADAGKIIAFIIETARDLAAESPLPQQQAAEISSEREPAITDRSSIRKAFLESSEKAMLIPFLVQIYEEGHPLTVRGICSIKEIAGYEMVLHKFRPPEITNAMEAGKPLRIMVSSGEVSYGASVTIVNRGKQEAIVSFPEMMVREKSRLLRTEASPRSPVRLRILGSSGIVSEAATIDISERGVGFSTSQDLGVCDSYTFCLNLPGEEDSILCNGMIKYKNEMKGGIFRYGAELNVSAKEQAVLARYIMERERKTRSLLG